MRRTMFVLTGVLWLSGGLAAADLWFADGDDLSRVAGGVATDVGVLPGGGFGVAAAPDGGVWVASKDEARLRRFDAEGVLLLDLITAAPLQGLAVAADGSVWATRPTWNDVWHVAADGTDLGSTPVGSVPYGVAVDRDGRVWVTNSFGNSVTRIDPLDGGTLTIPVGFFPSGIAASPDGTIWIAEKEAVRRLSADGIELSSVMAGTFSLGITLDRDGRVWVANQSSHDLSVFSAAGDPLMTVPTGALPHGIAGGGDGSVWVLCRLGAEVRRHAPDGSVLSTIPAGYPEGLGDLSGLAYALSVDPAGDFDGDGVSNEDEASVGFDPLDAASAPSTFVRGDANRDGTVELGDAISVLMHLFGGDPTDCPEALDVDDDGTLDLADPIYLIGYVLGSGPPPLAPFPSEGPDPAPTAGYPCTG